MHGTRHEVYRTVSLKIQKPLCRKNVYCRVPESLNKPSPKELHWYHTWTYISVLIFCRFCSFVTDNKRIAGKDSLHDRKSVSHNPAVCLHRKESIRYLLLFPSCIFLFLFSLHFSPMQQHHLLSGHARQEMMFQSSQLTNNRWSCTSICFYIRFADIEWLCIFRFCYMKIHMLSLLPLIILYNNRK